LKLCCTYVCNAKFLKIKARGKENRFWNFFFVFLRVSYGRSVGKANSRDAAYIKKTWNLQNADFEIIDLMHTKWKPENVNINKLLFINKQMV
jgi:hypothetical protein